MSLKLIGISKSFGKKEIFNDFSYEFSDSGIYAIKGASGVGKTTLLRIISGIDKKYTGQVVGGGFKNISFAFQEYRLFPALTALENITGAVWEKAGFQEIEAAKDMLFRLGFSENDLSLLPRELSGGMKQRVSLARAFLRNAPILLLDEPTKELDEHLAVRIRDMILEQAKSRLVIVVTHSEADILHLDPVKIDLSTEK